MDGATADQVRALMAKGFAGTVFLHDGRLPGLVRGAQGARRRVHRGARGAPVRHRLRLPRPVGQQLPPDAGDDLAGAPARAARRPGPCAQVRGPSGPSPVWSRRKRWISDASSSPRRQAQLLRATPGDRLEPRDHLLRVGVAAAAASRARRSTRGRGGEVVEVEGDAEVAGDVLEQREAGRRVAAADVGRHLGEEADGRDAGAVASSSSADSAADGTRRRPPGRRTSSGPSRPSRDAVAITGTGRVCGTVAGTAPRLIHCTTPSRPSSSRTSAASARQRRSGSAPARSSTSRPPSQTCRSRQLRPVEIAEARRRRRPARAGASGSRRSRRRRSARSRRCRPRAAPSRRTRRRPHRPSRRRRRRRPAPGAPGRPARGRRGPRAKDTPRALGRDGGVTRPRAVQEQLDDRRAGVLDAEKRRESPRSATPTTSAARYS